MYDMKALYEAESVENAVALRLEHPEAQIIAGGSDVLVQMREGKRAGKELISIYGLDELRGVSIDEEENIRIGSLSSFSHITRDPIIQKYINVLGEAVDMVGGPQIRNIGTIGGNTCNGVTSADSASTLHAWEAIVELTGKDGIRRLPIKDFYIKAGQVDIRVEDGEIQTAILIPKASYENCYGYYIKYAMRNAMDIATLGCSVNVRLSPDKQTIERARIAYGVAGPVPMRCPSAEAAAKDKPLTLTTAEEFSLAVLNDIHARDSWRASKAFRPHPTKLLMTGDPTLMLKAEEELVEKLGDRMDIFRSAPFFLELVPKGIDKAKSLTRLLTKINLTPADLIAFGDGYNDLSMLKLAGMGVAMENAAPEVRAEADYVTLSNEEDGVAAALTHFNM